MRPNKSNLDAVPIGDVVDTMFAEAEAAMANKEDGEVQEMIATHGREKVFCWLIGGVVRPTISQGPSGR